MNLGNCWIYEQRYKFFSKKLIKKIQTIVDIFNANNKKYYQAILTVCDCSTIIIDGLYESFTIDYSHHYRYCVTNDAPYDIVIKAIIMLCQHHHIIKSWCCDLYSHENIIKQLLSNVNCDLYRPSNYNNIKNKSILSYYNNITPLRNLKQPQQIDDKTSYKKPVVQHKNKLSIFSIFKMKSNKNQDNDKILNNIKHSPSLSDLKKEDSENITVKIKHSRSLSDINKLQNTDITTYNEYNKQNLSENKSNIQNDKNVRFKQYSNQLTTLNDHINVNSKKDEEKDKVKDKVKNEEKDKEKDKEKDEETDKVKDKEKDEKTDKEKDKEKNEEKYEKTDKEKGKETDKENKKNHQNKHKHKKRHSKVDQSNKEKLIVVSPENDCLNKDIENEINHKNNQPETDINYIKYKQHKHNRHNSARSYYNQVFKFTSYNDYTINKINTPFQSEYCNKIEINQDQNKQHKKSFSLPYIFSKNNSSSSSSSSRSSSGSSSNSPSPKLDNNNQFENIYNGGFDIIKRYYPDIYYSIENGEDVLSILETNKNLIKIEYKF